MTCRVPISECSKRGKNGLWGAGEQKESAFSNGLLFQMEERRQQERGERERESQPGVVK